MMRKSASILVFLLVAPAFLEGKAWVDAPWSRDPGEKALWAATPSLPTSPRPFPDGASLVIRLYQLLISSQDGALCPMFPTCSGFGLQAIKARGPFEGLLMTADRLLRDNPYSHSLYPLMPLDGRDYRYDPVEDHGLW